MAKIVSRVLSFVAGEGVPPAAYRIRKGAPNSTPEYTEDYEEVGFDDVQVVDGRSQINLADLEAFEGASGSFDIHVTAVDDAGNESDFLEVDNVLFDFDPPAAPTDGRVET